MEDGKKPLPKVIETTYDTDGTIGLFLLTCILNQRKSLVFALNLDACNLAWGFAFQHFVWSNVVVVDLHPR